MVKYIRADCIEFASNIYNIKNVKWNNGDVTKLKYKDNEFDVYVSYEVFEYLDTNTLDKYLCESKRVIKKGGKFIISTPNYTNRKHVKNPFHIKEYTLEEFNEILSKHYKNIKYFSTDNYDIQEGVGVKSINMIAVCES